MSEADTFTSSLGYLLVQVIKAHHERERQLLAPLGLYNGQEILLLFLASRDGQSQTALAERLCIQPATLTRSLDRMERSGLSERRPDPGDRRSSQVYLTRQGRQLCPAVEALWRQLEAETFGVLTGEEQLALQTLLEKVKANLEKSPVQSSETTEASI
jgi:DNA-binding MarR family transcriptional regulator